jgi:predicted Zn-dependent protease
MSRRPGRRTVPWLLGVSLLLSGARAVRAQDLPVTTASPAARRLFAQALAQAGDARLADAQATLQEAVRADSGFALAWAVLAFLQHYDVQSGTVQAERAVRLAGQATPAEQAFAAAVLVRETDRSAEAARQASELAGRYPDSWLAAWLAFDVALFKQRDLSAAERALRAGLARHPDHNLLQNVLGYTLRGQGRNEEAHAVFERNAAAHPDQPNPWDSLANSYDALGRLDDAIRAWERALRTDSTFRFLRSFRPIQHRLGHGYLKAGRHADAERAFLGYARQRPDEATAYHSLGGLYLATGRLDEAAAQFQRALALDSALTASRDNLVRVEVARGHRAFSEALGRRDAAAVAALYTPTAQLLPAGSGPVEGTTAIQRFWAAVQQQGVTAADVRTVEFYPGANGTTATEVGRYRLLAGERVVDEGKYLVVWQRTSAGWRMHRDMRTSDPGRP